LTIYKKSQAAPLRKLTFIFCNPKNQFQKNEYSGLIIQTGFAGFIESNLASFGISAGIDYLLHSDREVWIYTNKPFIGFIVGIALN
jgi:hypothetical protein